MAADKFNSVGGYSVGIPPVNIVDENGNITATKITAARFVGNLYGNVFGSSSTLAAVTIASTEPADPVTGMMWWDSSTGTLKIFSGTWVEAGSPATVRYSFTSSTTWLVQHNRDTTIFRETLTDSSGQRFNAGINIIDENSFEVVMTEATSGAVDVIFN